MGWSIEGPVYGIEHNDKDNDKDEEAPTHVPSLVYINK